MRRVLNVFFFFFFTSREAASRLYFFGYFYEVGYQQSVSFPEWTCGDHLFHKSASSSGMESWIDFDEGRVRFLTEDWIFRTLRITSCYKTTCGGGNVEGLQTRIKWSMDVNTQQLHIQSSLWWKGFFSFRRFFNVLYTHLQGQAQRRNPGKGSIRCADQLIAIPSKMPLVAVLAVIYNMVHCLILMATVTGRTVSHPAFYADSVLFLRGGCIMGLSGCSVHGNMAERRLQSRQHDHTAF